MADINNPPSLPGRFNSPVLVGQVPVSLAASGSTALGICGASGLYGVTRRVVVTHIVVEDPSTTATLATTTVRVGIGAGTATVLTTATLVFTASGATYQVIPITSAAAGSAFGQATDYFFEVIANGVAAATAKVTVLGYLE